jgi:hypothetical protein
MIGLRQGARCDCSHSGASPISLHSSIAPGLYCFMIDPSGCIGNELSI